MNPLKSNNIVAKILQVYAYVNGAAGIILSLLLINSNFAPLEIRTF